MATQMAMTVEDIQAKLSELKSKRAELENTLSKMSKDTALAMMAGEDMNKFEENRHKVAEESRHTGDLIAALEQGLVDGAKQKDINTLEKRLLERKETKPKREAAQQRLAAAQAELKEAESAIKELDEEWYGAGRVIAAYRDKLKKNHKMSDIELNQIEAKFKS
jgi:hypothetical protein